MWIPVLLVLCRLALPVSSASSLVSAGTYSPQGDYYAVGVGFWNYQGACPVNAGLCSVDQQGSAGWLYGLIGHCCDYSGAAALPTFIATSNAGCPTSVNGISPTKGRFFAGMQYPGLTSGYSLLNYDGSLAYNIATWSSGVLSCDWAYGNGVATGGVVSGFSGGWGSGMDVLGIYCTRLQLPCPPGTYSTGTGATVCTACASGLTSASGATGCTSCPTGTMMQYSSFMAPHPVYSASSGSTSSAPLNSGSYWSASGTGNWLQIDLGSAAIVKSSVTQGPGGQQITSYTLQSSSDGTTWAAAYTVMGASGNTAYFVHSSTTAGGAQVYNFLANSVTARYWRLTPVGYGSVQAISWNLELEQLCLQLDTVCSACAVCGSGTFTSSNCSTASNTVCTPCTTCSPGNYASSLCTPLRDAVCRVCDVCSVGQYDVSQCTSTMDTQCATCSVCPAGSYVSAACATTHDTTCSVCSTCAAGYYVGTACDATHDTVCVLCPANSWCSGGVKTACPSPSLSPIGSSTYLGCTCPVGTLGPVNSTTALCKQCPVGGFCPGAACTCG